MVSIWEGNQCKKAQLTLMEISAAIANKVVSQIPSNKLYTFVLDVFFLGKQSQKRFYWFKHKLIRNAYALKQGTKKLNFPACPSGKL